MNCDIKSQTLEELQAQFQTWEQPTYRVTQLLQWLYERRAASWEAMSNLPKALRGEGPRVVEVRTDREANARIHERLKDAAQEAVRAALAG